MVHIGLTLMKKFIFNFILKILVTNDVDNQGIFYFFFFYRSSLYLLHFEIKSCEYEILCHVWIFLFGVKKLNIRKSQDVFPVLPNVSVGLLIQPRFSVVCQTTNYECGQGAWEYSAVHLYWHGILFMSYC